jgi:hypothetical protein
MQTDGLALIVDLEDLTIAAVSDSLRTLLADEPNAGLLGAKVYYAEAMPLEMSPWSVSTREIDRILRHSSEQPAEHPVRRKAADESACKPGCTPEACKGRSCSRSEVLSGSS